jgi:hypothetical protein
MTEVAVNVTDVVTEELCTVWLVVVDVGSFVVTLLVEVTRTVDVVQRVDVTVLVFLWTTLLQADEIWGFE